MTCLRACANIWYSILGTCQALVWIVLCSIVVSFGILIGESALFINIVFLLCPSYTLRYPIEKEALFDWYDLLYWVRVQSQGYNVKKLMASNDDYSRHIDSISKHKLTPFECSRKQDMIVRICCINHMLLERNAKIYKNKQLSDFLQSKIDTSFLDVKLVDLRNNTKDRCKSQFIPAILNLYHYFVNKFDDDPLLFRLVELVYIKLEYIHFDNTFMFFAFTFAFSFVCYCFNI